MKKNHKLLHELPAMTEFSIGKEKYRTITALKYNIVNRCRVNQKRDVMRLRDSRLVKLGYFTEVKVV